jgi:hypothetical protein
MKLGIMQPYFLPYIGYFQLINAVDKYVIYDNIQYTKKGWINRNRLLQNGKAEYFTLSLKKDSDFLDVKDRFISDSFDKNRMLNQIKAFYQKAPYFDCSYKIVEDIIDNKEQNLFLYNYNSIQKVCKYLNINTELIISSTINIDHSLKGVDKVLAICKSFNTDEYINAIGGTELYNKIDFENENIKLSFLKTNYIEYQQLKNQFVPNLSILDVMMFNSVKEINVMLDKYELV